MIEKKSDNLRVFRDDLYPYLGGGNKGRKLVSISEHIILEKYNAVVSTGGINSNHCRALSIAAKLNNWKCTLVLHGSREKFYKSKGNALLIRNNNPKKCLLIVNLRNTFNFLTN